MTVDNPWPEAAKRLARRINARARTSALLERLGPCVFAGGLASVGARLLGWPQPVVLLALGAGALLGVLLGWQRRRRVAQVGPGAAAWALDRIGDRGEHGLAAAIGSPTAAAQAARAAAAPPRVRMLPPHGLAWFAAGLLAAGVAWMAPGIQREASGEVAGDGGSGGTETTASTGSAGRTEDPDGALSTVSQVRQALNLPTDGALNREALVKRLADPAARNRALEAAGSGTVGERLQQGDDSAEAMAQALLDADEAARAAAREARRDAAQRHARASARRGGDAVRVPVHRRGVVKRYLESLAK